MGESDITHNINFNLFKKITKKIKGLKTLTTTQRNFLIKMALNKELK